MTEKITLNTARKEKGLRPIPIGDKVLIKRGAILKPTLNDLRIAAGMKSLNDDYSDRAYYNEEDVPRNEIYEELLGKEFFEKFFTKI